MARTFSCVVVLVMAFVAVTCQGWMFRPQGDGTRCRRFPSREDFEQCVTCNLFRPKKVTLRVRNVLRDLTFEETVTLNCTRSKTLFYMMQEAADVNTAFRFTAKYFGSSLGFFIEGINNTFGDYDLDKSYWEILDGDLNQTSFGVSTYEPKAGETVTFNLTQGGHS